MVLPCVQMFLHFIHANLSIHLLPQKHHFVSGGPPYFRVRWRLQYRCLLFTTDLSDSDVCIGNWMYSQQCENSVNTHTQ